MSVIQSTSEVTDKQKQLRIIGEPSKVDYARQLINDLLTEKELEVMKLRNKGKEAITNEYGSMRPGIVEIPVPPQYIGLVIGKGGENIKRIQQDTGTKVQFDTTKSDANGNKICTISGQQDAVNRASDMVREIIDNALNVCNFRFIMPLYVLNFIQYFFSFSFSMVALSTTKRVKK